MAGFWLYAGLSWILAFVATIFYVIGLWETGFSPSDWDDEDRMFVRYGGWVVLSLWLLFWPVALVLLFLYLVTFGTRKPKER